MARQPFFSVVMPAFNAEATIRRAVDSLASQTYGDWELIISDDCSTDATPEIIREMASVDPRIRIIRTPSNSGSACVPRRLAVMQARGKYIVELDSDDEIPSGYLRSLSERIGGTNADVVLAHVCFMENGTPVRSLPDETLSGYVGPGRRLFIHTLDGWRIPLLGAFSAELYREAYMDADEPDSFNADEITSRRILLKSRTTAFAGTGYIYHLHPDSITRSVTLRQLGFLNSNRELVQMTAADFGIDSPEMRLAARQYFNGVADGLKMTRKLPEYERKTALKLVSEAYRSPLFRQSRALIPSGTLKFASFFGLKTMLSIITLHDKIKK